MQAPSFRPHQRIQSSVRVKFGGAGSVFSSSSEDSELCSGAGSVFSSSQRLSLEVQAPSFRPHQRIQSSVRVKFGGAQHML